MHRFVRFSGRIDRRSWWGLTLAILLAQQVVRLTTGFLIPGIGTPVALATDWFAIWIFAVPLAAVAYQRAHDLNWPGFPIALTFLALAAVGAVHATLTFQLFHGGLEGSALFFWARLDTWLTLAVAAGFTATLGMLPGASAANRYGSSAGPAAEEFA